MSDTINTIVDKKAYDELQLLRNELKETRLELVDTLKVANKGINVKVQVPKDLETQAVKQSEAYQKIVSQVEKQDAAMQKLQKQYQKLAESSKTRRNQLTLEEKLQRKLTQAKERVIESESEIGREIQKTRGQANANNRALRQTETFYGKVSIKLKKTAQEYKELSLRKQLMNNLTEDEIQRMALLEGRIDKYYNALAKADQKTGNFSRNVGNYKSGFDGMGFSIAQVSRELPAFANSMQTGFMAISNNIPMVVDEIQKLRIANKALAAEGKATNNVLASVGAAIFSWQTLLSLAVVALTVYGSEIVEFISQTTAAEKAQKKINEAMEEGTAGAISASQELKTLRDVVTDLTQDEEVREKALSKLTEEVKELEGVELGQKDAMQKVIDTTEPYIKAAEARAMADAFARMAAEAQAKAITAQNSDLSDNLTFWDQAKNAVLSFGNVSMMTTKNTKSALDNQKESIDDNTKAAEMLTEKFREYYSEYLKNSKDGDEGAKKQIKDREKLSSVLEENERIVENSIGAYEALSKAIQDSMKDVTDPAEYKVLNEQLKNVQKMIQVLKGEFETLGGLELELGTEDLQFNLNSQIPELMDVLANQLGANSQSLMDEFLSQYEWDYNNFLEFSQKKIDQSEVEAEEKKRIMQDYVNASAELLLSVGDLATALSDRKIANIEREQEIMNNAYDELLENEQLSEEQRKEIEKEREKENQVKEEKKKKEQQKQAKIAKAQAAFTIILTTAQAVLAALAPPPVGLGPVAGIPLAAITGGIGALQLATALAAPVPQYATGKSASDPYEGMMLWGEKQPEVKVSKDGTVEVATKPTFGATKKGDEIFPSYDSYLNKYGYDNIVGASILTSMAGNKTESQDLSSLFDAKLEKLSNKVDSAIKSGFKNITLQAPKSNDVNNLARLLRNQTIADV